jgi:hypothetical protein
LPRHPPHAPTIDSLLDAVAERVLDRLSLEAVRDSLAKRVGEIAERLVHEEIEQLKALAKPSVTGG